jgi:MFS family permease
MTAATHARAAFAHRDFRLYLAASFLTELSSQMLAVAVAWQVYAITHRALDLGYVGLAQLVPALGLSLIAGHVADRRDRARIVALCDIAQTVCAVLLMLLALSGTHSVLGIYAVLFCVGAAHAFSAPAGQALVPGLVPPEHFQSAVTWGSTTWQVATIVGPGVGGVLYGFVGASAVYAAASVAMGAAAVFMLATGRRPIGGSGSAASWETVLAGFRYVKARPVILGSVSLDLVAVLLGGATALLPIYASDILHVGPFGLGLLRSAPAVGAAAMAVTIAYHPLTRRAGALMLGGVAVFGAATVVFGLSTSLPLSLAALFVLGAADMVSVVVRSTVVQLQTPHEMRGRVSAVNMMFIAASNELGQLESGITAAWLGAVPAVVFGGVGTLVVVALFSMFIPQLRSVDRLTEAANTTE